jgi:hypothetical protein
MNPMDDITEQIQHIDMEQEAQPENDLRNTNN